MIFFTGRMDIMHLVDASEFRSVWSCGRGDFILVACGLERSRPPDQLIQHVFDAGLKVGDALQVLAVLPHRHEVGALDIDTGAMVAICSSAATRRNCSIARAPPTEP